MIFFFPEPLSADLVKALVASESSFYPETNKPIHNRKGHALGLMQVTDFTMDILSNYHGELSDHLLCFDHLKLLDPSANICAGIRWLFRKKIVADSKLKRNATWSEAVAEYKGDLGKDHCKDMDIFHHLYICMNDG